MPGGLLQLVLSSNKDIFTISNPQITLFKIVYRRYTNFSRQPIKQSINDPDFNKKLSVKLDPIGDLITKMYLKIKLNQIIPNKIKFAWIRRIGHAIIKQIDITIGGIVIDKQYNYWLDIWYELTKKSKNKKSYNKMIGDVDILTNLNNQIKPEYNLYIPLQFWFNRHYGLALPIIALRYHDIYLNIELENKNKLIISDSNCPDSIYSQMKILNMDLITDYIYLDIEERRRFALISHEYLIEQIQFDSSENLSFRFKTNIYKMPLNLNNQTKEIIFFLKNLNYYSYKPFLCYSNKNNWSMELINCSKQILLDSLFLKKIYSQQNDLEYMCEKFAPGSVNCPSRKNNLFITNNSNYTLYLNTSSLCYLFPNEKYYLIDDINASIIVSKNNKIIVENLTKSISDEFVSIPIDPEYVIDNRFNKTLIYINQFSNYGLYITNKTNPIDYSCFETDSNKYLISKNKGSFFNILQPYLNHSSTPSDGINLYSFALFPENHQPSGTCNMSRIENKYLTIWIKKILNDININDDNYKLYVYAVSNNILRIMAGFSGLAY